MAKPVSTVMNRKIFIACFIMAGIFFIAADSLYAQSAGGVDRAKTFNIQKDEPALKGYDPVAYFVKNKAVEGNKKFALVHRGVLYYFSSAENVKTFQSDPSKYEPQYGGWCAYAMGFDGSKVDIDPETFRVLDGKLYVFYNRFFNNTLKSWLKDEKPLKIKADQNWAAIVR